MLKWLRNNVLNKKEKVFRVCFIYEDKQKVFLNIKSTTPAKAAKSAKEFIKRFSKNSEGYKLLKVYEK